MLFILINGANIRFSDKTTYLCVRKETKDKAMKSILIVEDDITYGMMLKTWLGKKGFQVTSVSSIAHAQKHLETEGADLILSDLRLPDKDGIDLLNGWALRGCPSRSS